MSLEIDQKNCRVRVQTMGTNSVSIDAVTKGDFGFVGTDAYYTVPDNRKRLRM